MSICLFFIAHRMLKKKQPSYISLCMETRKMTKLMFIILNLYTLKDLGSVSALVNIAGRRND